MNTALLDVPRLHNLGMIREARRRTALLFDHNVGLEATPDGVPVRAGKPATVMLRRGGRPFTWG